MVPGHDKNAMEPGVRELLEHDKIVLVQIDKNDVMVLGHDRNVLVQIDRSVVQVHDSFVADDKREQLK